MHHRVRPSEPFTTALESPLPFKIPVLSMLISNQYPQEFEYGVAEYETAVEAWLNSNPLMSGRGSVGLPMATGPKMCMSHICDVERERPFQPDSIKTSFYWTIE